MKNLIDKIAPLLTEARKAQIEKVLDQRLESIELAIESCADRHNALAAVRTSEVFGIHRVHLITPEDDAAKSGDTSQGALHWVEIITHPSLESFLDYAKKRGLQLVGGIPSAITSLHEVPVTEPLCIMIGNEHRGLSSEARNACDIHYQIPMYGVSESLNLSVSAAISLYDLTSRKRTLLGKSGDLSENRRLELKEKYYCHSIDPRIKEILLKNTVIASDEVAKQSSN